jgi:GrpB-like predicted nucleotidyltransferase (UPF0157 family)
MAKVNIEVHNPLWLTHFTSIKSALESILEDLPILSIEHVGSTSIPGLAAKPVLDIDIIVSLEDVEDVRARLVKVGYTDLGELGVEGRWAMRQPGFGVDDVADGFERTGSEGMRMNLYVVRKGCLSLRNHQDVKRVLTANEELRNRYTDVKRKLVDEGRGIDDYVRGKNGILLEILREAGWRDEELEVVRRANEG